MFSGSFEDSINLESTASTTPPILTEVIPPTVPLSRKITVRDDAESEISFDSELELSEGKKATIYYPQPSVPSYVCIYNIYCILYIYISSLL